LEGEKKGRVELKGVGKKVTSSLKERKKRLLPEGIGGLMGRERGRFTTSRDRRERENEDICR